MLVPESSGIGLENGPVAGYYSSRVDHRELAELVLKLWSSQRQADGGRFASTNYQMQIVGALAHQSSTVSSAAGWAGTWVPSAC
jgi:hypothetical protein